MEERQGHFRVRCVWCSSGIFAATWHQPSSVLTCLWRRVSNFLVGESSVPCFANQSRDEATVGMLVLDARDVHSRDNA